MKHNFFLILTLILCSGLYLSATNPTGTDKHPDTLLFKSIEFDDNFFADNDNDDEDSDSSVPADDLYNFLWSSERLNPYQIKIDSVPDTDIDLSGFVFPTASSRITSSFGPRYNRGRFHYGTDIGLAVGDTIYSVFDGTIRIVDYEQRGYGHYVVIRHKNGLESIYAHFSKVLIDINQEVKAGDPIGLGGNTGRSTGPHLHFELRFLGNAFNTTKVINYDTKTCYANTYHINKTETFNHKIEIDKLKQVRYHKIKSGETLSHIARRYGTTVAQLCQLNKISKNTMLKIGRTIRYR